MSHFNDICKTCAIQTGKEWIKPGTEASGTPLHERAELDAQHPAVPVTMRGNDAQLAMLTRAMLIIALAAPSAATVNLETSDQGRYGFVLRSIQDADGNELMPTTWTSGHPMNQVEDEVFGEICDLNWDGVVGEDYHGYATIDLREFFAKLSDPAAKVLVAGLPQIECRD